MTPGAACRLLHASRGMTSTNSFLRGLAATAICWQALCTGHFLHQLGTLYGYFSCDTEEEFHKLWPANIQWKPHSPGRCQHKHSRTAFHVICRTRLSSLLAHDRYAWQQICQSFATAWLCNYLHILAFQAQWPRPASTADIRTCLCLATPGERQGIAC